MRSGYPSGLVLGPGIGRSPVRFPAPRRSFRAHFFVNFWMSWDVSGSGLGTFSDRFGMVLEKMTGGVERTNIFKNGREYFSCVGRTQIKAACHRQLFYSSIDMAVPNRLVKKIDLAVLAVGSGTAKARCRPCLCTGG